MQDSHVFGSESKFKKLSFLRWEDVVLALTLLVVCVVAIPSIVACADIRVIGYALLSVAVAVGIWALVRFRKNDDPNFFAHKVFPIMLAGMAIAYLTFFQPGVIPDEPWHFAKSYVVANLMTPNMDTYDMRNEDLAFIRDPALYSIQVSSDFWKALPDVPLLSSSSEVTKDALTKWNFDLTVDLPQLKVPSALGIMIGRSVGLSPVLTFYLGRLMNALYAVALIVLAVRLAPVGKNAIIATSLLPMSLHLIGSYSYDAGYIGFALLTTGMLLRLLYGKDPVSPKLMIGFLVCTAAMTPGKLIYALISLLGLLIPMRRFSSRKVAIAFKAAVLLVPMGIIFVLNLSRLLTMTGVTEDSSASDGLDHRGTVAGQFYSLGDIVSHPLESLKFLAVTFRKQGTFYITTLVGGSLGWFSKIIKAPHWLTVVFYIPLLMGLVRAKDDERALDRTMRIGGIVAAVMGVGAIILSMWIGWTFLTDEYIHGVQGRYVLPFLPIMLLALRPKRFCAPLAMCPIIMLTLASLGLVYLSWMSQAIILAA